MSTILAIDPGNTESAYAVIDHLTRRPLHIGKIPNDELRDRLGDLVEDAAAIAIEMVASYGMPVGRDVFETCVWIGRFAEHLRPLDAQLVYRKDVKVHHCHNNRAKDSHITQALIDRFAHNQPNRGKGTKADPGWFYGFKADIWQAYALAVQVADTRRPPGSVPLVVEGEAAAGGADTNPSRTNQPQEAMF